MRKSLWSPDEDEKLRQYVAKHGCGNWSEVAKHTGLRRCGKSCRLRWINYLRPDLKRGPFTAHEVRLVVNLHNNLGNSWSKIATHLPGRTDNDVKNFWHSYTRSRRLQQQQRQRMESGLPAHDIEPFNTNEEKPSYISDVYNSQTIAGVKKKSKEEKEHGYGHHHELSPLMFPSNTNISKGIVDCKVPSINIDNAPQFHFSVCKFKQLPCTSSNTNTSITNTNQSNHLPHYSTAYLPELKATNCQSILMRNHLDNDSEFTTTAICKNIDQSHLTSTQTSRSKLEPVLYASRFDQSTCTLDQASSSAVSSTSHIDSKRNFDVSVSNGADEWSSLMFSPSMQANNLMNSHLLADDAPAAAFDQACFDMDSKPPEGLQSVIWRFLNQAQDHPVAASSTLLDQHRSYSHHFPYQHQKPTSLAISSYSLSSEPDIQPPIQLTSADQHINVDEAFSSSGNLQYLQAELAADCFS